VNCMQPLFLPLGPLNPPFFLRPEISPVPPARLLITAERQLPQIPFVPEAPPLLIIPAPAP